MLKNRTETGIRQLPWLDRVSVGALFGIAALITLDLITDSREGAALAHIAVELLVVLLSLAVGGLLLRQLVGTFERERGALEHRLAETRQESEAWRLEAKRLIQGLGAAIESQFIAWGLSDAEKDVALLLLKGLSHKEIATLRSTAERTVRQQAATVYSKAGVEGRSGLSAFFLEDLAVSQVGENKVGDLGARPSDAGAH